MCTCTLFQIRHFYCIILLDPDFPGSLPSPNRPNSTMPGARPGVVIPGGPPGSIMPPHIANSKNDFDVLQSIIHDPLCGVALLVQSLHLKQIYC